MDYLSKEELQSLEQHKMELEHLYNEEDLLFEQKVIEEVPTFPKGFYPKGINHLCAYYQKALNIPSDFIKNNMLAVFGHAIGTKSLIEIKEEWHELAIVWTCNVAYPSAKKSPSIHKATKPVELLEEEADEQYELLIEEYTTAAEKYQVDLRDWESKLKSKKARADDKPIEPQLPTRKEFITKDATIEGLIELLKSNDVLNVQDEFAGFLGGMDMYKGGKGNERQKWLTLWGGRSDKVTRKGTRFKTAKRTSVNITGNIQPDKLAAMHKQDNDGLVERILFSYPKAINREWTDIQVPKNLVDYYHALVFNLHSATNQYKSEPFVVRFSVDGYAYFTSIMQTEIYDKMNDPTYDESFKSLLGKLEGYFGRFCLIKYWIDVISGDAEHNGEVNSSQVREAWHLVKYYLAHAIKSHLMIGNDEEEKRLQSIIIKIKDGFGGFATPRDIQRAFNWVKTSNDAYQWIEKIVNEGYGYQDMQDKKKGVRLYENDENS